RDAATGATTFHNYDIYGNVIETSNSSNQTTTYERAYATGAISALINAKNERTEYERDAIDRLTSVTQSAGTSKATTTRYEYVPASGGLLSKITDYHGNAIRFGFDLMGRVNEKIDPSGGRT